MNGTVRQRRAIRRRRAHSDRLGADSVLVGRPVIWGLAAAGEAGAYHTLEILKREFRDALGLSGCAGVAQAHDLQTISKVNA